MTSLTLAIAFARSGPLAAFAGLMASISAALFADNQRRAHKPVIRTKVLCDPASAALNAASMLMNLAGFAILLLVPFALTHIPGLTEAKQGGLVAATPIATVAFALIAGRLPRVSNNCQLRSGAALTGLGLLGCAVAPSSVAILAVCMIGVGCGQGLFQVAYLDKLAGSLPPSERGIAGSLAMLTRTLGILLGATVLMLVYQHWRGSGDAVFFRGFHVALAFAALVAFCALAILVPSRK